MKILNFIWQFPQYVIGFIMFKLVKNKRTFDYRGAIVCVWEFDRGVSFGKYIFVPWWADADYVKHEYGHSVQSRYLGWFYLLVIGLPSILWAGCCGAYRKKHNVSYYSFYTEKWADKLGGVERREG